MRFVANPFQILKASESFLVFQSSDKLSLLLLPVLVLVLADTRKARMKIDKFPKSFTFKSISFLLSFSANHRGPTTPTTTTAFNETFRVSFALK